VRCSHRRRVFELLATTGMAGNAAARHCSDEPDVPPRPRAPRHHIVSSIEFVVQVPHACLHSSCAAHISFSAPLHPVTALLHAGPAARSRLRGRSRSCCIRRVRSLSRDCRPCLHLPNLHFPAQASAFAVAASLSAFLRVGPTGKWGKQQLSGCCCSSLNNAQRLGQLPQLQGALSAARRENEVARDSRR
jgi:hypothetical protein